MHTYTREGKVEEFHRAMGTDVAVEPRVSLLSLREKLLIEECNEVCQELNLIEMYVITGSFDLPVYTVNNEHCVISTEKSSWGEVKSLFR